MSDEFEKEETEEEIDLTAKPLVDDEEEDLLEPEIPLSAAIKSGALGDEVDPEDLLEEEDEEEDDVPEGMYDNFDE